MRNLKQLVEKTDAFNFELHSVLIKADKENIRERLLQKFPSDVVEERLSRDDNREIPPDSFFVLTSATERPRYKLQSVT